MIRWLPFLTILLLRPLDVGWSAELTATEIVRRSDEIHRRDASYGRITMTIVRPEWTRSLSMEAWTEGRDHALIRILSPKKEKDVTLLKKGREAWQYVPTIDRTIKIPPSMMFHSWLGSDFTNDDVVRADSLVVDYTHEILKEAQTDHGAAWVIQGTPREDAAVVWDKVVFTISQKNFVSLRLEYYDEGGKLVKYYETFDVREIEGQDVPMRFTMYDVTRSGYQTTLEYTDLTFRPELPPNLFSIQSLKR